ncbi:MAG: hypothetical protein PVH77_12485 [Phycisphaerales bacterium]|jgi:hypothetical protein
MKLATRTIVTLVAFILVITNFCLSQETENAGPETFTILGSVGVGGVIMKGLPGNPVSDEDGFYEATLPYGWTGIVQPTKDGYVFKPSSMAYSKVTHVLTDQNFRPRRIGPAPMLGRGGSRKILVVPNADVNPEELDAITQDLQVMSQILNEKFEQPREMQGVFTDFGDFFGRDSRDAEVTYLQGYGALFLMEVNFTFSPPAPVQEEQTEEVEDIDPVWQRARQKVFSPGAALQGMGGQLEQGFGLEEVEQLKTELIKTLKHAANIRNLESDEWIIITVIGQARQDGRMPLGYRYIEETPMSSHSSTSGEFSSSSSASGYVSSRTSSSSRVSGGCGGGAGMMVGGMGGRGGYGSGSMGGYGMGGRGGMMGDGYGEMGLSSPTVLTIRVKKSDIDAFAAGELDFEEFHQKVKIFNY